MRGQVLETTAAGGMILGEDGQRYKFMGTDWKSAGGASEGATVDFIAVGERATQVYRVRMQSGGEPAAPRSAANGDNSVLLGWLGIACLVISLGMPVVPVIGAFILGLMGASRAKASQNATGLLLSRVAWIGALGMAAFGVALFIYAWPLLQLMWLIFFGYGSH